MASIFEQTITPKLNFSNFPLNEWQLVSCNFGQLIPVYCKEVLPNDVFTLSAFQNVNFAPMVAPMYHEVNASLHFFYVPARTVWENFETFITGSEDGHVLADADVPVQAGIPDSDISVLCGGATSLQGTVLDYLGLPNQLAAEQSSDEIISDIPLRSYFKIWYDFYRDENLQVQFVGHSSTVITYFDFWRKWKRSEKYYANNNEREDMRQALRSLAPFYRSYRKEYFTAALPTPQKGEPVTLNLGSKAPVTLDTLDLTKPNPTDNGPILSFAEAVTPGVLLGSPRVSPTTNMTYFANEASVPVEVIRAKALNATTLTDREIVGYADLTKASAITVEALREAIAVQEILESLSTRGSRFCEFLRGNFGVTPDDYRLQRPQFIGGLVSPVQVQQVLQTSGYSGTDSRDMTGYAAGRAFAASNDRIYRMRFKEHGYIIGIFSVMPKAYYFQGVPRHFRRKDRFDYYLPQTAHLGEQGILNEELYYTPGNTDKNHSVFGYIPRWAEYKTSTSGIHGDFRGNLNYYHMARVFSSTPTLSESFISSQGLQTRPFAVWQTEHSNINHIIWSEFFFRVTGSRCMPYHSVAKVQ